MAFALEQAIDEAALRMNLDPIELRTRWDPDPNRQRLYNWAAGLDIWKNRMPASSQAGRYRRGVGVASGYWLYLWQTGSSVELAVKGGRIIEMGPHAELVRQGGYYASLVHRQHRGLIPEE